MGAAIVVAPIVLLGVGLYGGAGPQAGDGAQFGPRTRKRLGAGIGVGELDRLGIDELRLSNADEAERRARLGAPRHPQEWASDR